MYLVKTTDHRVIHAGMVSVDGSVLTLTHVDAKALSDRWNVQQWPVDGTVHLPLARVEYWYCVKEGSDD